MSDSLHTRISTLGGTITVMLANIFTVEIAKTAVLAAVGAAVSYLVSISLKWLVARIRARRE